MSTPNDPSVPPLGGTPVVGTGATDLPGSGYDESQYGDASSGGTAGNGGAGAKEKAKEAASVATDEGKNVASTAADQAKSVAETAKGQARSVTVEAKNQAQRVLGDAHGELSSQLEQRVGQAAEKARSTGDQLRALAEGRVDEAGPAADWVRQASEQIADFSDRLNDMGLEGATQEVRRFARQRPLMFVAGAAAAGFLIGRTFKNATADQSSSSGQQSSSYQGNYGVQRPVAGSDPYAVQPDVDLAVSQPVVASPALGSPLGTEVTPLGGGGGVIPSAEQG